MDSTVAEDQSGAECRKHWSCCTAKGWADWMQVIGLDWGRGRVMPNSWHSASGNWKEHRRRTNAHLHGKTIRATAVTHLCSFKWAIVMIYSLHIDHKMIISLASWSGSETQQSKYGHKLVFLCKLKLNMCQKCCISSNIWANLSPSPLRVRKNTF